ncbi:VOC family protein [Cryobacterium melibiosiphilum]|uniref:VOC family protein n=1 Tax=Cryobacterium melibiosiphilum TaxID=995039 RepID=A0A3A5MGN1_9MICO|nr:VOC family protein [Cryobacterium melibiosiphilum]RJT88265.1 VOC family protein [Cryobacterium melibiosiphilum]
MKSTLNPYLSFREGAREAMDFYHGVFGGELTLSTFGEMHASEDPAEQHKIMHSELKTDAGFTLMASDTPNSMEYTTGSSISVSLSGDDDAELRTYWDGLADGGIIALPLEKAPWGDSFGMIQDRFGVNWMVNILGPKD